ncbi:hypothetical protein AB9K34_04485 [Sedimentitalea sp. XS_ASV28]|uniref:hypothetical protein n=1 Tax=Sedimentitalea sp. XS_ASV28 TaxID=3241296 RepID=UPI0035112550
MKSTAFIEAMAFELSVPQKTMVTYTRFLKEAGLLTTGARGVNAPHMTPLDAARVTIALLVSDTPGQAVERVKRFGGIRYSPAFRKTIRGYKTIQPSEFEELFEGETLEEVLTFLYAMPEKMGVDAALEWNHHNVYHLRAHPFDVLVELFSDVWEDGEIVGERVIPFKGKKYQENTPKGEFPKPVSEWTFIKGGIRVERMITGMSFLSIGMLLAGVGD